ncbi:unnamed protein product [Boreogadus saida]
MPFDLRVPLEAMGRPEGGAASTRLFSPSQDAGRIKGAVCVPADPQRQQQAAVTGSRGHGVPGSRGHGVTGSRGAASPQLEGADVSQPQTGGPATDGWPSHRRVAQPQTGGLAEGAQESEGSTERLTSDQDSLPAAAAAFGPRSQHC